MTNQKTSKSKNSTSKENNKNDGWVSDPKQQPEEGKSVHETTTTYRNSNEKYDDEALNG